MAGSEDLTQQATLESILHRRTLRRRWLHAQRHRLRPVWRQARPFVVIALALAVLVLGTIGFQHNHQYRGDSPFDSFYRALGLFGLGGATSHVGWELQIARILGPLITGYAAVQGLLALSRQQFQLLWFRVFLRRHVLVAGLGEVGFRLAVAFHEQGFPIVAVERDPANPGIAGCHERGVPVLIADATDPETLRSVRGDRADLLIACCGDDGTNMNVAAAATNLSLRRRTGMLTALVHIYDEHLLGTLQAEEMSTSRAAPVRLEYFNVFHTAAYILLEQFPPFPAAGRVAGSHAVLVVGFDGAARSLVTRAARLWHGAERDPDAELSVVLIGPTASEDRARLLAAHPELASICDLHPHPVELDVTLARVDLTGDLAAPVSSVYVCVADEADGMAAGMTLRTRPETHGAPTVITVADRAAGVASSVRDGAGILEDIDAFGVLSSVLDPSIVLRGNNELIARAKHEEYLEQQRAAGAAPGPATRPWDELGDELKDANRRFADGIGAKLEAIGCTLVPAPLDADGSSFGFSSEEVEELAPLEHERWVRDKVRAGWRYGPVRDDERRIHPLMVPWAELPEPEREKDRSPMRELPRLLARVGLEVQRSPSAGTGAALPEAGAVASAPAA